MQHKMKQTRRQQWIYLRVVRHTHKQRAMVKNIHMKTQIYRGIKYYV